MLSIEPSVIDSYYVSPKVVSVHLRGGLTTIAANGHIAIMSTSTFHSKVPHELQFIPMMKFPVGHTPEVAQLITNIRGVFTKMGLNPDDVLPPDEPGTIQ